MSQSRQDLSNPRYAASQILVKLKVDARPSAIEVQTSDASQLAEMILPEAGLSADSLETNAAGESGLYVVQLAADVSVDEALRQAAADPRIAYAEPDYLINPMATTPDDSRFDEMWGLSNSGVPFGKAGADIGATNAWDLTTGSEDVVVAITDTGADLTHPDLAANAWVNQREIPGNSVDDDANGLVDDINGWNFLGNNNQLVEGSVHRSARHARGGHDWGRGQQRRRDDRGGLASEAYVAQVPRLDPGDELECDQVHQLCRRTEATGG